MGHERRGAAAQLKGRSLDINEPWGWVMHWLPHRNMHHLFEQRAVTWSEIEDNFVCPQVTNQTRHRAHSNSEAIPGTSTMFFFPVIARVTFPTRPGYPQLLTFTLVVLLSVDDRSLIKTYGLQEPKST